MTTNGGEWTTVNNKRFTGKGGNQAKSTGNSNKKNGGDGTKKFTGHDKGALEGIVLTENGSITQLTELQDRLQTVGGSKFNPKVGSSIESLERYGRADFAPTKPSAKDWTETKEVDGKLTEIVNEDLKEVLLDMYKEEVKQGVKDFNGYTTDMKKVYALALGQVDDGMKEKLKSNDGWEEIKRNRCPVELLKLLRDICFQGNKTKIHTPTNIVRCLRKLLCSRQRTNDCTAYVQGVTQLGEVLESIGGEYVCPALIKHELETNTKYRDEEGISYQDYLSMPHNDKTRKRINHTAFQQFISAIIIEGSDHDTSTLKEALGDQYSLGDDKYPATTTQALDMLNHFKGTKKGKGKPKGGNAGSSNHNSKARKIDQKTDVSTIDGPHDKGGAEATTFVNKGVSFADKVVNHNQSARSMLMKAMENDDDFGHEMDNYFQLCIERNKECGPSTVSHCHVQWGVSGYGEDDSTSDHSSNYNTDFSTDDEENWEYWATHDAMEDAIQSSTKDHGVSESDTLSAMETFLEEADEPVKPEECAEEQRQEQQLVTSYTQGKSLANAVTRIHDITELNEHKSRYGQSLAALNLAYTDYQALRYGVVNIFKYSNRVERLLAQASNAEGRINENWILLDSESSCNLITNAKLVTNIRKAPDGNNLSIYCNSGIAHTDQIADLPGYGEVWFYPDGIASVLSLALVSDNHRVTMDTWLDNALYVHKQDGSVQRFGQSDCNLYYHDVSKAKDSTVLALVTVDGNKQQFSDLDVRRADKARKLQESLGFPTSRELIKMLDGKLLANSSVTRRDVQNAEAIYGKHSSIVKGKQVRKTGEHVKEDLTIVPQSVLDNYKNVIIHVDIFTVNGIRFIHSISRHIRFRTARAVTNAGAATLLDCIRSLCGQYRSRGFTVTQVHADNQFECIREELLQLEQPVQLHCVGAGQHEPTIERSIRTVKENVRCYFNHVPFTKLPKRCIIELVYAVIFWLNCRTTGVCKTMSAREMLTGLPLDAKECKFQFMQPILAHVDDTDNTMTARAVEALYLRPTGSLTGGFWGYDINTGKRIHRTSATETPLTESIVKRVEAIAAAQNCDSGIMFGDGLGHTTILDIDTTPNDDDDDASDESYSTGSEDSEDDHSLGEIDPDVAEVDVENTATEQYHDEEEPQQQELADNDELADEQVDIVGHDEVTENDEVAVDIDDEARQDDEDSNEAATDSEPVSSRLRPTVQRTHNKFGMDDGYTPSSHSRSFFTAGYQNAVSHLHSQQEAIMLVAKAIEQYNNLEASPVTPQYGVKKGIKLFGEAGVEAVLKELKQIHDRKVLSALDPKTMTKEMVQQALPYLMFLKRKRDTSIKGRGCADGRKQREYIRKEDATSPTVSLYALVLSCMIDAIEERDVATVDIPGAFLQTDMPEGEDVYIRLDGTMAELLCRVDPKMYSKYIFNKNGKKTLFTRAEKAIYGTLRAALLFWEKLYGQLEEWGYEMNPYDPCTVNKVINGGQCTIVWHVDDLKISHRDPEVVTGVINELNKQFGVESPLTETRGKIHDYVGMTLDYSTPGKVKLSMFDYLEDILQGLPESLQGTAVTPASDHLFKTNDDTPKLQEDECTRFHHYVAKLLYMSKRTRPDIQTAVAFLCTRIAEPDTDDWKKLKRVMSYLRETAFLPLVLGWDETGNVYWHVDAAFAVHKDMRSHSGGVMTLGQGAAITTCTKQKLNTKSSTEAEVVGVDDNMNFILWTRYFLMAQSQHMADNAGDPDSKSLKLIKDNILYQDNESAIKLERNGRSSSTKRTRHINIRYFFVTDRVKKGEVTVEYCPTDEIVADYFTKPLQGAKFRKFRNTIQGVTEQEYLHYKQLYKHALRASSQGSNAAAASE